MNLDTVTDKHVHEIERLTKELLEVMRKAKLQDEPLTELLRQLQQESGRVRRERFDGVDKEYSGY